MAKKTVFRQSDVTRAAKGLKAAGVDVTRMEIAPDGKIIFMTGADGQAEKVSAFDEWKAKRDARSA